MKKISLMTIAVIVTSMLSSYAIAGRGHFPDRGHHHHDRGHSYVRHHKHHHSRDYIGPVLGGLIVGGIIGSSLNSKPVYVNSYPRNVISGNTFLRKSNGNCYLISNDNRGNQILSSVPDSNCD